MATKIFCDIAELNQIKKFNKKKIVKGFTTNPSLMRKAGAKNYKSYSKKILKICNNKPVSLEVFADEYKGMKKQALQINTWGKNVYVKVPVTNSKGFFMGKIIKELNSLNIIEGIVVRLFMFILTKLINLLFLGANSSIYIAVAIPIGKESIKVMLSAKSEPINAPKIPDCSDSDESPLVKKVLLKNYL